MCSKKIDYIDIKILRDLLIDGRKEFTAIAEEAGVSKDVIWHRYKEMEKTGVITGATSLINYAVLGYRLSASIRLVVPVPEQQRVIDQLNSVPGIFDSFRWGSTSVLCALLHLADVEKLEDVKERIRRIPSVHRLETDIWTGVRVMQTNLSALSCEYPTPKKNKTTMESKVGTSIIRVDELDRKIIERLLSNSRAPFRNIAEKTGASTSTVMRRFQELVARNVIKPTIQINPLKIGYHAHASFRLRTRSQDSLASIVDNISKIPDVFVIFKTIGSYDFTVFTFVKDFDHLLALENRVGRVQGVQELEQPTVLFEALEHVPYPGTPISDL